MPRAYTRRARRGSRQPDMPPELMACLYDEPMPADADPFLVLDLDKASPNTIVWDGMTLDQVWAEYKADVLADWTTEAPGTRPSLWWLFSAPRLPLGTWPGCFWDGTLPEPRKRLGGTGTPAHEVLAYAPAFPFGLPARWVSDWDVAYYTGRAKDLHGNTIGTEFKGKQFNGVAPDPDDPPIFESQAAYLDRFGLLLPGERERLPAGA